VSASDTIAKPHNSSKGRLSCSGSNIVARSMFKEGFYFDETSFIWGDDWDYTRLP
jgi:hypothetical protein